MIMPPPKKAKAKKAEPLPTLGMSTTRFELGLGILSELDTESLVSLLSSGPPPAQEDEGSGPIPASDDGEFGALLALLKSVLHGRILRRLAAVALAQEDELEEAEEDDAKMAELVRLRGRAPFFENFEAVKGFFVKLGISNLSTLVSFAGQMANPKAVVGRAEVPGEEPAPSGD